MGPGAEGDGEAAWNSGRGRFSGVVGVNAWGSGGKVPSSRPIQLSLPVPDAAAVEARPRTTSTPDSASFSRASFFVAQVPSRSTVSPPTDSWARKAPSWSWISNTGVRPLVWQRVFSKETKWLVFGPPSWTGSVGFAEGAPVELDGLLAPGCEGLCFREGEESRMACVAGEERYSFMSKTGRPAACRAVVWIVAVEQGFSERGSSVASLDAGGEGGSSSLAVWKLSWLLRRRRCCSRSPMVADGHNGCGSERCWRVRGGVWQD